MLIDDDESQFFGKKIGAIGNPTILLKVPAR
jgi:hypothetical protein